MIKPVNSNLILKKLSTENKTESGILVAGDQNYVVVGANDDASALLNKKVYLMHEPIKLDHEHFAIPVKDVLAFID